MILKIPEASACRDFLLPGLQDKIKASVVNITPNHGFWTFAAFELFCCIHLKLTWLEYWYKRMTYVS